MPNCHQEKVIRNTYKLYYYVRALYNLQILPHPTYLRRYRQDLPHSYFYYLHSYVKRACNTMEQMAQFDFFDVRIMTRLFFFNTFTSFFKFQLCGWGMFFEISDLCFSKIDLSFTKIYLSFWKYPNHKYIKMWYRPKILRLRYLFAFLGPEFYDKYLSFAKNLSFCSTWVFRKMSKKSLEVGMYKFSST